LSAPCVVILNWNGRDDTLRCLESAARLTAQARLVVVDNGSRDNSVSAIRGAAPGVTVIEAGTNLGYAGGMNLGIAYCLRAGPAPILLLNNDTVLDPDVLSALDDAAARNPRADILAPLILDDPERHRIWYGGGQWNPGTQRFAHTARGQEVASGVPDAGPTSYACGCAMYLRAGLVARAGTFDERFFLTYEDTDLSWRARRAGSEIRFVPDARVFHRASASFGGEGSPLAAYFLARNRLLWGQLHLPARDFARMLTRALGRSLRADTLRQWNHPAVRARRAGMTHFFARRFHDAPRWLRSGTAH